ncbi:hypothetical protein BDV06DRAFT_229738 [Aspergillus oleicola]
MENIVSQIRALATEADPVGLANIQSALRQALFDLERPQDTLMQLYNEHLRIAVVRIGISSGLFRSLSQSLGPLSVHQLAKQTKISPQLCERITRFLASNKMIDEAGQSHFKANKNTNLLANPAAEAFASHAFDLAGPAIQALPGFIIETGYADVTDSAKTPFQKAFNTDLSCFAWMIQNPEQLGVLQQVMKSWQSSDWMIGFELFEKEAINAEGNSERVFFVDVGGGSGHQCAAVRDKYIGLKGQLELSEVSGVRVEANDFLQEQKFYYLRHVLHDWPDAQCIQILQNLRSAMTQDSRVLINEVTLPETNVPWQSAMADLSMMVLLGARERTREQWAMLAQQSGLRITDVHEYNDSMALSWVIVLEID